MGITIVTPFWGNQNAFGCAHNVEYDTGLTDWGKIVVEACFSHDLILDVSHASHKSTSAILKLANQHKKTVVATHSNFVDCCTHSRNLTLEHAEEIKLLGGLIGLNLYPPHLGGDTLAHFKEHFMYAINHNLEYHVCLGTDFDGIDTSIQGINKQDQLITLYQYFIEIGYQNQAIEQLFSKNGIDFLKRHSIPSQNSKIS